MERLVVFLTVLAVCSGCFTSVPKDFVFNCPAPNNKGLQAVFEEFSKIPKLELNWFSSSSLKRIGKLLYENKDEISSSPEYEKLKQFLCDKAFVDSTTYQNFFWIIVTLTANNAAPAEIPDSELRENFLNFKSELYQTDFYRKSQEVLYEHVRSDRYAQLGMKNLYSTEMRKLLREVLNISSIQSEVDRFMCLGIPVDEAVEFFAYMAVSSWTRNKE